MLPVLKDTQWPLPLLDVLRARSDHESPPEHHRMSSGALASWALLVSDLR
jgi:hypothetical protein